MFTESPRFPVEISIGAQGGPSFNSTVVGLESGGEQVFARWQYPLHEYDVAFGVKTQTYLDIVKQIFWVKKGQAGGLRFKDWADYTVDHDRGVLAPYVPTVGAPVTPGVFQISKLYSFGTESALRKLKKPNTDVSPLNGLGQQIKRNGSIVSTGFTIDNTTGLVTFAADATSVASSITVGTTTTVVLAANLGAVAGNQIALSGFAGADAALVNGLLHTIVTRTGTGPYTFVLSTNTAGKTITIGTGAGSKYAQSTDTLTVATCFDVPVRFNTDKMMPSIDDYNVTSWGQIPLIEQRFPG